MENLEELIVLADTPKYSDHKEMLFKHLMRLPGRLFLDRMVAAAQVQTPSDWLMRKTYLLTKYKEILGEFPPKTPLNPQVTGVIEKDDYIIEKVIFESRPEFYVTANLYVPKDRDFPTPAVVCPLSHWEKSKAEPQVQAWLIGLVKKGYVALAYDPIGQGERLQYYDIILGKSAVGGPVNEHTMAGNQCFLTGATLAQYRIWDGIRAVDYLYSRIEVDSENIACTGASGGGTLTMYLVPLEERIKVSIPVAAIWTLQRSWESGGISDAEQNLPKSVLYGVDYGDILSLVAPRPLMIICECKDYIRMGTRDAYYEAERLYRILGVEDRIQLVEINREMREQMYGWLNRWFHKEEEGSEEPLMELETEENLNCTESGQLMSSLKKGKTVFELNRAYAERVSPQRRMPKNLERYAQYRSEVRRSIEAALGYTDVAYPLEAEIVDVIERDGYLIEKIIYQSEADIAIPGLAFIPRYHPPPYPGVLYLHENGKDIDAKVGGQIERLTKAGYLVFAIDPRGVGETKPTRVNNYDKQGGYTAQLLGFEAVLAYDCLKIGATLFGMQLQDVIKGIDYLFTREDLDIDQIGCIGWGVGGLLALYAGAIDERLEQVAIIEALYSYKSLLDSPVYKYNFSTFIPDVIRRFDLCDVAALVAPRTLMLINPVDAMKHRVSQETIEEHYAWSRKIYQFLENPAGLMVLSTKTIEYPERNEILLGEWKRRKEGENGRKACRKQTGRESKISLSFRRQFGGASSWIENDVLKLPGRKP